MQTPINTLTVQYNHMTWHTNGITPSLIWYNSSASLSTTCLLLHSFIVFLTATLLAGWGGLTGSGLTEEVVVVGDSSLSRSDIWVWDLHITWCLVIMLTGNRHTFPSFASFPWPVVHSPYKLKSHWIVSEVHCDRSESLFVCHHSHQLSVLHWPIYSVIITSTNDNYLYRGQLVRVPTSEHFDDQDTQETSIIN